MEEIIRTQTADFCERVIRSSSPHSVFLVQGARQVGKTTFVKQALKKLSDNFPEQIIFNLEEEEGTIVNVPAYLNLFTTLPELAKIFGR